jgi:hypothetical protein
MYHPSIFPDKRHSGPLTPQSINGLYSAMKSALTAALSGAPAPANAPKPPTPAGSGRSLDPFVFPCLLHAPDDPSDALGSGADGLADAISSIDLKSVHAVGSVPTNIMMPNGTPLVSLIVLTKAAPRPVLGLRACGCF